MLICEIGNCFWLPDASKSELMENYKLFIRTAHNCGADIVKGQAFLAEDIYGSMPRSFYKQCQFTFEQYLELIAYARDIGTDLFYSIFSPELKKLEDFQNFYKSAASQTADAYHKLKDVENEIVSVRLTKQLPILKNSYILHVTDYLATDPELQTIDLFNRFYNRQCGLSDHTIGINACLTAIDRFGVHVVEKHFHVGDPIIYKGKTFRDSIHGASPFELEQIANHMAKRTEETIYLEG